MRGLNACSRADTVVGAKAGEKTRSPVFPDEPFFARGGRFESVVHRVPRHSRDHGKGDEHAPRRKDGLLTASGGASAAASDVSVGMSRTEAPLATESAHGCFVRTTVAEPHVLVNVASCSS